MILGVSSKTKYAYIRKHCQNDSAFSMQLLRHTHLFLLKKYAFCNIMSKE